jgi:hypothetical protein
MRVNEILEIKRPEKGLIMARYPPFRIIQKERREGVRCLLCLACL